VKVHFQALLNHRYQVVQNHHFLQVPKALLALCLQVQNQACQAALSRVFPALPSHHCRVQVKALLAALVNQAYHLVRSQAYHLHQNLHYLVVQNQVLVLRQKAHWRLLLKALSAHYHPVLNLRLVLAQNHLLAVLVSHHPLAHQAQVFPVLAH
jgi:hypothetical protein